MSRWENIGDKYLLNVLGGDPLAAQQSVAMYFDPVEKCLEWHTNGHVIRFRPDFPSAPIGAPVATSFGYEINLAGGVVFGIGDVSLTKRAGILNQWGLEGVQIYYIVPVGQIPDIPVVRIEKIDILDGMIEQLDLTPQGVLSAHDIDEGCSRVYPWVDNSMPIYWKNKRNNTPSDSYMTGKILQKAPPLAHPLVCADLQAGNAANRSFAAAGGSETIGWYEVLSGGFQKAFNYQDLADARGAGTHYAFAATLGYTSIGGSNVLWGTPFQEHGGPWTSTEAGDVVSQHIYMQKGNVNPSSLRVSLFDNTTGGFHPNEPNTIIANTDKELVSPGAISAQWLDYNYSGPFHAIAVNDIVWMSKISSASVYSYFYDNVGNRMIFDRDTVYPTWTSPTTLDPGDIRSRQVSQYITISAAAGGIIPQIMHHRQLQRRR